MEKITFILKKKDQKAEKLKKIEYWQKDQMKKSAKKIQDPGLKKRLLAFKPFIGTSKITYMRRYKQQ